MRPLNALDVKIEEVICCPVCHSGGKQLYKNLQDRLFNTNGNWSFSKCSTCQTVWLNFRPQKEDIQKYYFDYFTHGDRNEAECGLKTKYSIKTKILDLILFKRRIERDLYGKARLIPLKPPGRILDIGCGDGSYMDWMRKNGWDVIGCEPDPKAAHIAKTRLGLNVINAAFEDLKYPPNSFDAITLNHVIEHVYDPKDVIIRCFELLKFNGKLAIITPNISSFGHNVYKSSWFNLDPPRHIVIFSPETLCSVLKECKFTIQMAGTSTWSARWSFGNSSCIRINGRVINDSSVLKNMYVDRIKRLIFVFIAHYGNIIMKNIGEEIGILAIKEK